MHIVLWCVVTYFNFKLIVMEKTNPLYEKEYPDWKKNLWGAFRAFFSSFLAVLGFMLTQIEVKDFENRDTVIKLVVSISLASLVGGLVAVGKFLRDLFPDNAIVQKLPI